jgi:hypothetical protein
MPIFAAHYQRPAAQTLELSEGQAGTAETVQQMCRLIEESSRDPEINGLAIRIVRAARVPEFDFDGERRAIYQWIRRSIRFFADIEGKETLRTARRTVEQGGGDCDCQTILALSLLKTIGHRTRIVTIATNPAAPDLYSHVFGEVRDERGRWTPLDTARKKGGYGAGPRAWYMRRHWDTEDGSSEEVAPKLNFYIPNSFPLPTTGRAPWLLQPGATGRPSYNGGVGYLGAAMKRRMRRRLRGLGQDDSTDGFNWSDLTSAINAGTAGAALVINATNGPQIAQTQAAAAVLAAQQNSSNSTLLLLGVGAVVLVMMMGKK